MSSKEIQLELCKIVSDLASIISANHDMAISWRRRAIGILLKSQKLMNDIEGPDYEHDSGRENG